MQHQKENKEGVHQIQNKISCFGKEKPRMEDKSIEKGESSAKVSKGKTDPRLFNIKTSCNRGVVLMRKQKLVKKNTFL